MTRWERSVKSWDVNPAPEKHSSYLQSPSTSRDKASSSSWKKLRLLLWKNWTIQMRHKWQTIIEILIPVLFTILLVVTRVIIKGQEQKEITVYPPLKATSPPYDTLWKCDKLYYAPKNNMTNLIMDTIYQKYFHGEGFEFDFLGFDTEEELVASYLNVTSSAEADDNFLDVLLASSPVLAGIVFEGEITQDKIPQHLEYKLRFPASLRGSYDIIEEQTGLKTAWFVEIMYPLLQLLGPRARNKTDGGMPGYREEGFLYLQNALDQTFIRLVYNETENGEKEIEDLDKRNIFIQRYPYIPYSFDLYLFSMQGFLPMLMVLSFIYPVINITKSIVYEKEKRLKESMKMMGLSNWLHWMAWFIKAYIFLTISCVMITLLLKAKFSEAQKLPIIPETDGTIIFTILMTFSFYVICFCFFVSSLFSRANPSATAAGAMWIIFYSPYAFIQPRYNLLPFWSKIAFSTANSIPICMGCQIISLFEGSGEGLQWSNINLGSSPDDNFSMAYVLLMIVINSVIYLLLALYIEAVWPGEFGIPLPWNFFLKKWYWTGGSRDGFSFDIFDTKPPQENYNIEKTPRNVRPGIQIKNMTKRFGKKTAVNKLNLDIYEGQITALLGHNGAGKTTTISMLTGLYPPTSGTAKINGFDIQRDMPSIRKNLGICPQHNVLFDELTVAEHLEFFCLLKGMDKQKVEQEINRLLASVGLESKKDAKSRTLSGGMKRKLSVLIALCAGSKFVLLDEPTSGMDSGSRRCTWDLIQSEKKGRTIILSTHFMEEADVLGDKIAIMALGHLECYGSSLFLKKRYGGGYNLIIVKNNTCDVDRITKLLKDNIPDAEIDQNVGAELSYILPDTESHRFPAVFQDLETRREELGIDSYGASVTTIEEVFMKVLKDAESRKSSTSHQDLDIVKDTSNNGHHTEINHSDLSFLFNKEPMKRNTGFPRLCQQMWAMLLKKGLHVTRNKFLVLFQTFLPLIYLNLAFFAIYYFPGFRNPEALNVGSLERYETVGKTTTLVKCLNDSISLCPNYVDYVSENYVVEALKEETIQDVVLRELEKSLTNVNYKYIVAYDERKGEGDSIDIIAYFNNQPYHGPPVSMNFISNAMLRKTKHKITPYNHPLPFSKLDTIKEQGTVVAFGFQTGYNLAIAMSFLVSTYVVFLVRERITGCKHLQFVSGVRAWLYWTSHFITDYIAFAFITVVLLVCLNMHGIEEFGDYEVRKCYFLIMGLFGLAILPLTYLLSFTASNPTTAYSRLVMFYSFIGLGPMVTMVLLSFPIFYLDQYLDISNNYFLISPPYAMGQGIMQLSANYHLKNFCGTIAFLEDVCAASNDKFCCQSLKQDFLDWDRMGVGKNVFYLFISFIIYSVLLIAVEMKAIKALINVFRKQEETIDDNDSVVHDPVLGLEDSDVLAEQERIRKTELHNLFDTERLIVRDLTKVYNKFVAVDHLNFAVQPGECFGLLGVNGAGKTTTFKQLTGDISPTDGDAFVCGKSVRTNIREVHECIGYTPQFDGLIDELSGRETIRMFARLKGIPEKYINNLIDELGQVLMFSQHLDKWTHDMSGGNKRKVSTAVGLVGKPDVVLLDEPSSGMDPVARRHLWSAISMIRRAGTSIVLTTHSLEEAEALSTRIGIMVNGTFRCLGSPQHLKNKFSKGYTLIAQTKMKMLDELDGPFTRSMEEKGRRRSSIRTPRSSIMGKGSPLHWESGLEDLRRFIEDAFPDCVLKDIHPGFVHYHILPSGTTSWGKMFETMEEARVKFDLEAYSVGQTTLEQIFLQFSKAQIND